MASRPELVHEAAFARSEEVLVDTVAALLDGRDTCPDSRYVSRIEPDWFDRTPAGFLGARRRECVGQAAGGERVLHALTHSVSTLNRNGIIVGSSVTGCDSRVGDRIGIIVASDTAFPGITPCVARGVVRQSGSVSPQGQSIALSYSRTKVAFPASSGCTIVQTPEDGPRHPVADLPNRILPSNRPGSFTRAGGGTSAFPLT